METVLKIVDFHKSFGEKSIHRGTSFDLYKGECLGLLGGSGTGKSVVLRALVGLERPDKGKIIYKGKEIHNLPEKDWLPIRKEIAYVFQNGALFDSLSVAENLAYPLERHTSMKAKDIFKEATKNLNQLDLYDTEHLFPSELSGGMQKRVGMARSLMLKPELILFDEPTAGLDPKNTIVIQDAILKLKKMGYTSVLVTHDMETALSVCNRIMLLEDKKISMTATREELKDKSHPLYQFIKGAQN